MPQPIVQIRIAVRDGEAWMANDLAESTVRVVIEADAEPLAIADAAGTETSAIVGALLQLPGVSRALATIKASDALREGA